MHAFVALVLVSIAHRHRDADPAGRRRVRDDVLLRQDPRHGRVAGGSGRDDRAVAGGDRWRAGVGRHADQQVRREAGALRARCRRPAVRVPDLLRRGLVVFLPIIFFGRASASAVRCSSTRCRPRERSLRCTPSCRPTRDQSPPPPSSGPSIGLTLLIGTPVAVARLVRRRLPLHPLLRRATGVRRRSATRPARRATRPDEPDEPRRDPAGIWPGAVVLLLPLLLIALNTDLLHAASAARLGRGDRLGRCDGLHRADAGRAADRAAVRDVHPRHPWQVD